MPVYPPYSSTFSRQSGRILRVGRGQHCPFKHISDAISASQPYDRIEIESGEYYEAISLFHPLELASTNDDEPPCINARGPCITVNEAGPVLIENIKVVAKGSKTSDSMAILVVHGSPLIRGCELSAVQVINDSCPTVTHCKIQHADRGCGLVISHSAGGEYMHNDIGFHPEECVRIQSTGQPNLHNNRILQSQQCRAVVMIAGGKFAGACQPIFCDNIISGNGEISMGESPDPAIILTASQLTARDIHSAESLVHISWGAKPVLKGNFACNGIHGFLIGGTVMPAANFNGNRIANCTGWAVAVGDGTGLLMQGCEIQQCAGAVRVFNNALSHFGQIPLEGARRIDVVSHKATRVLHRRASRLLVHFGPEADHSPKTPTAQRKLWKQVDEQADIQSADAMRAFRRDILTALKRDAETAHRQCPHPSGSSSPRLSVATTPVKTASAQCISRSSSFRREGLSPRGSPISFASADKGKIGDGLRQITSAQTGCSHADDAEDAGLVFVPRRVKRGRSAKERSTGEAAAPAANRLPSREDTGGERVELLQCTFRRNFHFGVYIENSLVSMSECRFVENMVGLVLSRDCRLCTLVRNTFDGNVHAGVLCTNAAEAVLEDSVICGGASAMTAMFLTASGALPMPSTGSQAKPHAITRGSPPTTNQGCCAHAHALSTAAVTARSLPPTLSPASATVSAHGLLLQSFSSVTLHRSRISHHGRNIAVLEGSALVASANQLQRGSVNHLVVSDNSHVDLVDNVMSDSAGGAVVVTNESRARLCHNHIHSSGGEGVLTCDHSHADLYENVLHACHEALSVRGGSDMYAEGNTATLGGVGLAVRGERSEMTLVGGRLQTTTNAFCLVEGTGCLLNVRGTHFDSSLATGFVISDGATATFEKCRVVDCKDGFCKVLPRGAEGGDGTPGSLDMYRCHLTGAKGVGIDVQSRTAHREVQPLREQSVGTAGAAFALSLRRCTLIHCESSGLRIEPGAARCHITKSTFTGCLGIALDVGCGGTITDNAVDGWHAGEVTNGIAGMRLAGHECTVEVHRNTFTDCVIGLAVEAGARASFHDDAIVNPVEAGVVVTGRAPGTQLRDVTVTGSDGVGVLVKDGARASFARCRVAEAAVAGLVVGHGGRRGAGAGAEPSPSVPDADPGEAAMFKECVFAGHACEVLADSHFRMGIETDASRKAVLHALLHVQARQLQGPAGHGFRRDSSRAARGENALARRQRLRASLSPQPAGAHSLDAPRKEALPQRRRASAKGGAESPGEPPAAAHDPVQLADCRIGGPQTKQCVVALHGAVSLVRCSLAAGPPCLSPPRHGRAPATAGQTAKKRRPRVPSDDAFTRGAAPELSRQRQGDAWAEGGRPASSRSGRCARSKVPSTAGLTGVELLATLTGGLGVAAFGPGACVHVSRSHIEGCYAAGVKAEARASCNVEGCTIADCEVGVECVAESASSAASQELGQITVHRVTLTNCAVAGIRCAPGGVCLVTESQMEQCGVAILLGTGALLRCQRSTCAHLRSHGVCLIGTPHPSTRFEDVHIHDCEGAGVSCGAADGEAPQAAETDEEMPLFHRCEVRYCKQGSAWVEGSLRFQECIFHARPAAPKKTELVLAFEAEAEAEAAVQEERLVTACPRTTTVVVQGREAVARFGQCHFLASSCTAVQLVVSREATATLTECVLEGGPGARGVAALHPRLLSLVKCGLHGFGASGAVVYAPLPDFSRGSARGTVTPASARRLRSGSRAVVGAPPPSAPRMLSALAGSVDGPDMGMTDPSPSRGAALAGCPAEIHLEGCRVDCVNGPAFRSEEHPAHWAGWDAGEASPEAAPESVAFADMGFSLRCVQCSFAVAPASTPRPGTRAPLVSLGHHCARASLHSCSFEDAGVALRLQACLPASHVEVCHCAFSGNETALQVQTCGHLHVVHCTFARQTCCDIVLRSGDSVVVERNRFERCAGDEGSIVVRPCLDAACLKLWRFAGDRWHPARPKAQADLVRAWAAKRAEDRTATGDPALLSEWVLQRNAIEDCRAGVAIFVPETLRMPAMCLPSALSLSSNTFQRCGAGVSCETCDEADVNNAEGYADSACAFSTAELASVRQALRRDLDCSHELSVNVLLNTFRANRTGMDLSTGAQVSMTVWRNSFEGNNLCGLSVAGTAEPVVGENTFTHHDGDGSATGEEGRATDSGPSFPGEAGEQRRTEGELADETLRKRYDPFAAVCVKTGAGGTFTRNVLRENLVGMCVTDPRRVVVRDNLFVGNDRGVRIATDNETPRGSSVGVVNNTFLSSGVCDIHASAFTCIRDGSAAASSEGNAVLLAFNRFASPQVPVSVLLHDYAEDNTNYRGVFHLCGNVFTANARCAARFLRCTALDLQIARNLFFAVGFGVVVGPHTRGVTMVDNFFAQHAAAALSVLAESTVAACGSWFVCYPDHVTVMVERGDGVSLADCHFHSLQRLPGSPDPCVVFAAQSKKSLVAQCTFAGKQAGVLVEGRSSVSLTQTSFKGSENGLVVRGSSTVRVDATCLFTGNSMAGVLLQRGSCGTISLLNTNPSNNTVLAMGEHEVELEMVSKLPGPLAAVVAARHAEEEPFKVDLSSASVAELEEQLVATYAAKCLLTGRVPPWVLEKEHADDHADVDAASPDDGTLGQLRAAFRDALQKSGEEANEERGEEAASPKGTEGRRLDADADVAARGTAKKSTKRSPKQDPSVRAAAALSLKADELRAAMNDVTDALAPHDVPMAALARLQDWVEQREVADVQLRAAACTECGEEGSPAASFSSAQPPASARVVSIVDLVEGILSTVVRRGEAQRAQRALQVTGAPRDPTAPPTQVSDVAEADGDGHGEIHLPGVLDMARYRGPAAVEATMTASGRDRKATFGDTAAECSARASAVSAEEAAEGRSWDPFFTREQREAGRDGGEATGETVVSGVGAVGGLAAGRSLRHSQQQPQEQQAPTKSASVAVDAARGGKASTVGARNNRTYFPLQSEGLQYTVWPVSRMALREKSLLAYALERRRRERVAQRGREPPSPVDTSSAPPAEATGGEASASDPQCQSYALLQTLEVELDTSFSYLFPSYKKERVFLTKSISFDIWCSGFCLYEDETEEPFTPVLRAFEEEVAVVRAGESGDTATAPHQQPKCDSAWARFWEERERQRAHDERVLESFTGSRGPEDASPHAEERVEPSHPKSTSDTEQPQRREAETPKRKLKSRVATASPAKEAPLGTRAQGVLDRSEPAEKRSKTKDPSKKKAKPAGAKPKAVKKKRRSARGTSTEPEMPAEEQRNTPAPPAPSRELAMSSVDKAAGELHASPATSTASPSQPTFTIVERQPVAPAPCPEPRESGPRRKASSPSSSPVAVDVEEARGVETNGSGDGSSHERPPSQEPLSSLLSGFNAQSVGTAQNRAAGPDDAGEENDSSGAPAESIQGGSVTGSAVANENDASPSHDSPSKVPSTRSEDGHASHDDGPVSHAPPKRKPSAAVKNGMSGLPMTAASSLRPPVKRPSPVQPHSAEELQAALSAPPVLQSSAAQDLWDVINKFVSRSDPTFLKNVAATPTGSTPVSRGASTESIPLSPTGGISSQALLAGDPADVTESLPPQEREEVEDILALLHWLAERRRFMEPETYEAAFEKLMEGTQVVRPFSDPRTARGKARRVLSSAASNELSADEVVVYLPLSVAPPLPTSLTGRSTPEARSGIHDATEEGGERTEDGEKAPVSVRCVMVRLVHGRGVTALRIVHLSPEELLPNPATPDESFHRARERMAKELLDAHPDVVSTAQTLSQQQGGRRQLSATSTLFAAGLVRHAAGACGDGEQLITADGGLGTTHALSPPPASAFALSNPFKFPSVVVSPHEAPRARGALSYEELQRELSSAKSAGERHQPPVTSASVTSLNRARIVKRHKPHRVVALQRTPSDQQHAAAHGDAKRKISVEFDPANPSGTTPFNVASEQPHLFRQGFLASSW